MKKRAGYMRKWRKNNPWVSSYRNAKDRCTKPEHKRWHRYGGRGIKFLLTMEEVKNLWFRDKAYKMKKASIDRIDNDGHYEYSNCRFIERVENARLANSKAVIQYTKDGKFVMKHKSITEASKKSGGQHSSIWLCCQGGRRKTCAGYKWEYLK